MSLSRFWTTAAGPSAVTLRKLAPPADGHAYFGITFRLFDTSDLLWGTSVRFDERIHDSIANELAGKTPMFIKVWSEWQHAGRPCKPFVPFADAMGDIAKERSVVGDGGVLHLDGTSPLHFRERRRHGAGSRAGQDRWLHPSLRPRREELRPTRPERVHTATAGAGATHVPWDPARSIDIDGGRVNCVPDINDHDSRLLAGGPSIQALFASRIASPRYVSTITTESVASTPELATATLLASTIRGRTAIARRRGNLAADTSRLSSSNRKGPARSGRPALESSAHSRA